MDETDRTIGTSNQGSPSLPRDAMPLDIVCSIFEAARARWLPRYQNHVHDREKETNAACREHAPLQPHTTPTPDAGFKPQTPFLDPTVWDLARARQGLLQGFGY